MAQLPRIAYYIDEANEVRSGALVRVTEPSEEEGGETLYEFGHGFSTPKIFESEEEARKAL